LATGRGAQESAAEVSLNESAAPFLAVNEPKEFPDNEKSIEKIDEEPPTVIEESKAAEPEEE